MTVEGTEVVSNTAHTGGGFLIQAPLAAPDDKHHALVVLHMVNNWVTGNKAAVDAGGLYLTGHIKVGG